MVEPKFGTVEGYQKNQIIFEEGQLGNIGYLVKTGEVTIYKIINDEKKILSKLGPGEIFGEMCIVNESPRTAFAEATEDCDLVIIDKTTLFGLLKKSPKMIQSITILLMKRLANTLNMLEEEDSNSISPKKVFSLSSLLELMNRYDKDINYLFFSKRAMNIARVNQKEIDAIMKILVDYNLIEVSGEYQKMKTSGCTIRILDSQKFLIAAKEIK
jgi:CRP-like cAMP-binding protein